MLYYKDDFTDFCMHHNMSFPRYRNLARKALSYYLGDKYNPETFDPDIELFLRQCIQDYVEMKVVDKQPYDWQIIDNFFKKVLFDAGFTHLTYDIEILNKGYNGVMRGDLPTHWA